MTKSKILSSLGFVSLFFFILSLAIAITINFTPLYAFDIDYLNIARGVGMTKETILRNYAILMDYLNFPWVTELRMPDFPSSGRGLFHFWEVKKLFLLDYGILVISGIGSLLFLKHLRRAKESWRLVRFFQWGSILPPVVIATLLVNFDAIFVLFHEVFFNNDAWLFNPSTDPIINALPATFFLHSFLLVFALLELFFLSGYFLSTAQLRARAMGRRVLQND